MWVQVLCGGQLAAKLYSPVCSLACCARLLGLCSKKGLWLQVMYASSGATAATPLLGRGCKAWHGVLLHSTAASHILRPVWLRGWQGLAAAEAAGRNSPQKLIAGGLCFQ